MAIRRDESSDNGFGPRWLRKWIEAQEQRSREQEKRTHEHEERMRKLEEIALGLATSQDELRQMHRESTARLTRSEDTLDLLKEEVARNRRHSREIVAELSRMDAERRRDRVQYARMFKGMITEIRRIGRR